MVSLWFPQLFLWLSSGFTFVFFRFSLSSPWVFLRFSYGLSMFSSYGFPQIVLGSCLNLLKVSLDVPVVFLGFTYGLPVVSP